MSRSLRILMICPQFSPLIGGYERAAERLAEGLANRGHRVTVVSERRYKAWLSREERASFEIRRLWCIYRSGWHTLSSLVSFGLYLLLNGRRYDIYHVHQYGHLAAITVLIGKLYRRPVVLKVTNTGAEGIVSALAELRSVGIPIARLHRAVDACIATTRTAHDEAVIFGIAPDRVWLIPNGLDTAKFSPVPPDVKQHLRTHFKLDKGPVALFCGRLSVAKNPEGLLRAWQKVAFNESRARLVMIGDGPLRLVIEDMVATQDWCSGVSVIGEQSDVVSWYRAADLFVLFSDHEGLSNSLLEAMSCGLPVVSTEVSGSMDIVSACDIGELVRIGSENELAAALSRLLTDPERRAACGARARQYAEDNFSISEVARRTEQLYVKLLSGAVAEA